MDDGGGDPLVASLHALEKTVNETLTTLWTASVIVEDGDGDQNHLRTQVDKIFTHLQQLEECARDVDVMVPLHVLEKVDDNVNPDAINRDLLMMGQVQNDEMRGRMVSTHLLKHELEARLNAWKRADNEDNEDHDHGNNDTINVMNGDNVAATGNYAIDPPS